VGRPLSDVVVKRATRRTLITRDEPSAVHKQQHRPGFIATAPGSKHIEPMALVRPVGKIADRLYAGIVDAFMQRQAQSDRCTDGVLGHLIAERTNTGSQVARDVRIWTVRRTHWPEGTRPQPALYTAGDNFAKVASARS